jgi:hypothetical protein
VILIPLFDAELWEYKTNNRIMAQYVGAILLLNVADIAAL